jgi:uncharacterized protein (TIGR03067 family)
MRTLSKLLAAVGLAAVVVSATAQEKDDGKDGALKLEGKYTIVKGERDGQPIPADRLTGSVIRFTKDEVVGTDKDTKELFVSTYKLDTGSKPWKILFKTKAPKEAETTGLIKKDGDTIVLVYAFPGGKEPTEFKTGEKQQMFWLKMESK